MDPETQPGSQEVSQAAAAAVSPDPETQAILAKHAAGAKLSASERGKLGGIAKAKNALLRTFGIGQPAAQPAATEPAARNTLAMGASAPAATSPGGVADLPVVPIDPGIAKRTTAALLEAGDKLAVRVVGNAAVKAGADDKTVARFERAASLPPDSKAVMVEVSPDVLTSLGLDPKMYPLCTFFGLLGLWGTGIANAVMDLKAITLQKEKSIRDLVRERPGQPGANGATAAPATQHRILPRTIKGSTPA